jgi:hypothetical protein
MSSSSGTAPAPQSGRHGSPGRFDSCSAEAVGYLLQIAAKKVDSQGNNFDQLDAKTGVLLGFALVAVVQVLAALFQLWTSNPKPHLGVPGFGHPHLFALFFALGVLAIALAAGCGLATLLPKTFEYGPGLDDFLKSTFDLHDMQSKALDIYVGAIRDNQKSNDKKVRLSSWGASLLFAALLFLMVSIGILYWPMR